MFKAYGFALPLLMALSFGAVAAVPDDWKQTAYAYEANHSPLATVLTDFTTAFGVKLDLDPAITGTVDGKMRSDNPQAFLERLALEYHFQWFVYNNTLYVSPRSDQTSVRIEVSPDAVDDLQKALTDVGLLDSRFGWGILPDEGVVLVRGPKRYVDLIRDYSEKVESPDEKQEIIVLPLRYANAADRTIQYRDQQLKVSGVASILQGLLEPKTQGQGPNGIGISSNLLGGTPTPSLFGGYGGAASGMLDASQGMQDGTRGLIASATSSGSRSLKNPSDSTRTGKIRVEADERNNAVLIYDLPKRQGMYQKLVAQLDVPRNLVEIDAIILDINRNDLAELSSNWSTTSGKSTISGGLTPTGSTSTVSISNPGKFSLALQALQSNGAAKIIGNPSILTLENQPAVIDISQTEYLSATGENVADIVPITAGTSLQVIPRTERTGDKKDIQLVVDIEDGEIDASSINETQPSVRKANVSTQAVIAEKGSLVIGGFHTNEDKDTVSKVPLLGDIPYIGNLLFRYHNHEINRRERVFILTPRVIGDQVDPARYAVNGNADDLDDAEQLIKDRRSGPDVVTRAAVERSMVSLASGVVPPGFGDGNAGLPFEPGTLCDARADGVTLDTTRSQWYSRKDWGIAVVVARNTSPKRVRLDESLCGGRWVLGVGAWPHAWLNPGEKAEVFIALRQPAGTYPNNQLRNSLLDAQASQPLAAPANKPLGKGPKP